MRSAAARESDSVALPPAMRELSRRREAGAQLAAMGSQNDDPVSQEARPTFHAYYATATADDLVRIPMVLGEGLRWDTLRCIICDRVSIQRRLAGDSPQHRRPNASRLHHQSLSQEALRSPPEKVQQSYYRRASLRCENVQECASRFHGP
jgi:hypothetical protein